MKYTMTFAMTEDFKSVLLLLKPEDHKNPLFRGRWTVPGGLLEPEESVSVGAAREFFEETGIALPDASLVQVADFYCNCDPTETEHLVTVFGTILPIEVLRLAEGEPSEPVSVFDTLPENVVWQLRPLLELVIGRLMQPRASVVTEVPSAS